MVPPGKKVVRECWQDPLYLFLLYQRKIFISKVLGMFLETSLGHWPQNRNTVLQFRPFRKLSSLLTCLQWNVIECREVSSDRDFFASGRKQQPPIPWVRDDMKGLGHVDDQGLLRATSEIHTDKAAMKSRPAAFVSDAMKMLTRQCR